MRLINAPAEYNLVWVVSARVALNRLSEQHVQQFSDVNICSKKKAVPIPVLHSFVADLNVGLCLLSCLSRHKMCSSFLSFWLCAGHQLFRTWTNREPTGAYRIHRPTDLPLCDLEAANHRINCAQLIIDKFEPQSNDFCIIKTQKT